MRYFILTILLSLLLLTACQRDEQPTPTAIAVVPSDTATVVPTATPTTIPTDTPTNTPTATLPPTATDTPTLTPEPTATPTNTPTNTPTATPTLAPNAAQIIVSDEVVVADVKRLGLNIGQFNTNGAGILMKNVMPNPGFESAEFHSIFIAADNAGNNRVPARPDFWNTDWNNEEFNIGQPEGFWQGAQFEVLTGSAAGRTGNVVDFTHEGNQLVFYLGDDDPTSVARAAVMVRQEIEGFIGNRFPYVIGEPNDVRPDSPGEQSALLTPRDTGQSSFTRFLDQFAQFENPEAGKLLQMDGQWHFSIWAKAASAETDFLRVLIEREGSRVFYDESFPVTDEWSLIEFDFVGDDPQIDGVPTRLRVDLFPLGGEMLVDDVTLRRTDASTPTRFSDRVIESVTAYQPGVVRFWASNLSLSLDNALSAEFAHKPSGFSPRQSVGLFFTYSLHEFLDLAQLVDAEPWYVIPPTFTEAEAQNLVAYLAAPAGTHPYADIRAAMGQAEPWTTVFDTIHLEWGNEIWGGNNGADPFLGATMGGGVRAAEIANRRFAAMRSVPSFDADIFNLIIGGQFRFPGRQTEIERGSDNHNTIAIAPYYGVLEQYETDEERYYPLYAHAAEADRTLMAQSLQLFDAETSPAIYEINLHIVENDLPNDIRNEVLGSQGAGISLPLIMLTYLRDLQIRDQAVWELVEFSTRTFATGEWGRLFGIMRDLEATYRPRPTYIGLQMTNEIIGGDMVRVDVQSEVVTVPAINRVTTQTDVPLVQAFAFQDGDSLGLVLFNLDIEQERQAVVTLPLNGEANGWLLASENISDGNEDALLVERQPLAFDQFGEGTIVTLPPHSMITLEIKR